MKTSSESPTSVPDHPRSVVKKGRTIYWNMEHDSLVAFFVAAARRGVTRRELLQQTGWNENTISPRVDELLRDFKVIKAAGYRRKGTTGNENEVYVLVNLHPEYEADDLFKVAGLEGSDAR